MSADMLSDARNLFDRMPATGDKGRANRYMQSIIFEGDAMAASGAITASNNPEETQIQDNRGPFTLSTYDQVVMQAAFMQERVGLDLDDFLLDHMFPDD
ncbi:DNA repair protein rhp54 [Hordeum vulgare]|nr:DNA repair protein rhp54 [Hordeum vulgare]